MGPTNTKIDATLARYLLGNLSPEQVSVIDEKLLADESYMPRLNLTESALICDFICGGLADDDRERLERRFLRYGEKARKIEIAQFLYYKAHQPAALDDEDSAFEYLLGNSLLERSPEIEERELRDEDFRARLDQAEYELILAYLRRGLSSTERERFEWHFLCAESSHHAERIEKLRFTEIFCAYARRHGIGEFSHTSRLHRLRRRLSEPVNVSIGTRSLSRPVWQPLAAATAAGLGVMAWLLFLYQSPIKRGLDALYATYEQERPVEPRLTGFGYARYPKSQNGEAVKFDRKKHDEAFSAIVSLPDEKDNPDVCHALGLLYITEKKFDDAIDYLGRTLTVDAQNAKLHNDIAVALLAKEKAKKPGESSEEDLAEALEHLRRAIELDDTLLEAHFNVGLCHQYQKLWRLAAEDWRRYLAKDPQSQWADEARKNLRDVEERIKTAGGNRDRDQPDFWEAYKKQDPDLAWQIYKRSRLNTGSLIANKLIDDCLSSALSDRSAEAHDKLRALLFIGDVELAKTGDRFTQDLANFYRDAPLQRLRLLVEARDQFKSAYAFWEKSKIDEAIKRYLRAKELFDQSGDVCESLAAQRWLGHCYFRQASTKRGLAVLTQGAQEAETRKYVWLLGMFHNDLTNINGRLTKYSKALDHGLSQLECARKVEDDFGVLSGLNRVTETYVNLAMYRDALTKVAEGLSLAAMIHAEPAHVTGLLTSASTSYVALGKYLAALDYQKEALTLALEIKNPWLTSRHYAHLGLVCERLNRHSEAIRLINSGEEIGRELNNQLGREIAVYAKLHLGQIYREIGDLDNSVKSYQEALQLCNEADVDIPARYFSAKRGLLLTRIQQGSAAEEELQPVIDLFEQSRINIEEESARNSFFDREQSIYDVAIDFTYSKLHDARRAYDYSEISRARSLLDTVELPPGRLPEGNLPTIRFPHSVRPLDLDQIQSRLPDKTVLLQYAALRDKLIVWVVSRNDIKSHVTAIGYDELNSKISGYLQSLSDSLNNDRSDYQSHSSNLYAVLVKPVERWLEKDVEIAVVPDKALNRLPFVALISGSGKYLIEEHVMLTAPSANMFIISSEKAREKERVQAERLLSVGNPTFDNKVFRNLAYLADTASQAAEVAALYRPSAILLEKDAKESSIRREIERSDVAHFAMHYVADERSPMLSALPLAEDNAPVSKDRDGMLQTYEFYGLDLSRLRLVVLSACQPGIERYYNGEGAVGLARAFEGAGIPLVVASLWPAQADFTKGLLIGFHKYRKRDALSTARALRQSQLDMIKSSVPQIRSPYTWATYAVIGGHAEF